MKHTQSNLGTLTMKKIDVGQHILQPQDECWPNTLERSKHKYVPESLFNSYGNKRVSGTRKKMQGKSPELMNKKA